MTKKNTKLSGLNDEPEATPTAPAPSSRGKFAFVVYEGYADPDQRFEHTGPTIIQAGAGFMALEPGLNIVDASQWLAAKESTPGRAFRETNGQLDGLATPGALRDLAARTEQPEALELMLTLELAKPVTAPRGQRRNQELVAVLEGRLAVAVNRPALDVSDLHTVARQQSLVTRSHAS